MPEPERIKVNTLDRFAKFGSRIRDRKQKFGVEFRKLMQRTHENLDLRIRKIGFSERLNSIKQSLSIRINSTKVSLSTGASQANNRLTDHFNKLKNAFSKHRKILYPTIAAMTLAAVLFAVTYQPIYAVEVDGEAIGFVHDVEELQESFQEVIHEYEEQMAREVIPSQTIEYVRVQGEKVEILEADDAKQKLLDCVTLEAAGHVIVVEGKELLGLASCEEAESVLETIKEEYAKKYVQKGSVIESIEIEEEVVIEEMQIPLVEFKKPEEAVAYIMSGGIQTQKYEVCSGDSLWSITKEFSVSMAELLEANPQIEGEKLSIGQELNLQVANPYLNIISREKIVETEKIAFSEEVKKDSNMWTWERKVAQRGQSGRKQVVYEVIKRNGIVVEKDKQTEEVIQEPVTQIIVRGSRQDAGASIVGTGRFLWPVQGRITSRYGPRSGGFHTGVDIAAPRNTPIRAADDGTVSVAVYSSSGYGNRVEVNHGNGYSTLYAHCNSLAVRQGQTVKKGQIIAYVGSTGRSSGDHLHFEIRINGDHVNPMNYF